MFTECLYLACVGCTHLSLPSRLFCMYAQGCLLLGPWDIWEVGRYRQKREGR